MKNGQPVCDLSARLFLICLGITGNNFRERLDILKESVPEIEIHEVSTGASAFDWTVPNE